MTSLPLSTLTSESAEETTTLLGSLGENWRINNCQQYLTWRKNRILKQLLTGGNFLLPQCRLSSYPALSFSSLSIFGHPVAIDYLRHQTHNHSYWQVCLDNANQSTKLQINSCLYVRRLSNFNSYASFPSSPQSPNLNMYKNQPRTNSLKATGLC